ncbi:hypothetical protein C8Q80DRAFT_1330606, partial [Daedaleopsis nitida]
EPPSRRYQDIRIPAIRLFARLSLVLLKGDRLHPSTHAQPSNRVGIQQLHRLDAVYNHRPLKLAPPLISIYHLVFASLRCIMAELHWDSDFTHNELTRAQSIVNVVVAHYSTADKRIQMLSPELSVAVHASILANMKLRRLMRKVCCCPALLLGIAGPNIIVSGVAFADKCIVGNLTDYNSLVPRSSASGRPPLDDAGYRAARLLRALKACIDELNVYYEKLSQDVTPTCKKRLIEHLSVKAVFVAEAKGADDVEPAQVVVKFQKLHRAGFVFGDLRRPNVLIVGDKVVLIDFDWCEKEDEARYPSDVLVTSHWMGQWRGDVGGGFMVEGHDEFQFEDLTGQPLYSCMSPE